MIEFIDSVMVPNIGIYETGEQVELDADLEKQLVRCEKAKWVVDPETEQGDKIVPPPKVEASSPYDEG